MPKEYMHIQTIVPIVGEQAGKARAMQIANRLEDFNGHAERGWELTTTATIPAIDTLSRGK